jgi:hypothetical protein
VYIIKRKRKFEIRNSLLFISDSIRILHRTYEHLRAENYIDNKAAILVRVDEKFAAENKDLRGTIFKKKRKKKRNKFFNFFKESE